jgi:hypothetical protein
MYFVSPDFYSPKSKQCIVWEAGQRPSQGKICKAIIATGVQFMVAEDKRTEGFGCGRVVQCEQALGQDTPVKEVGHKLYFNGKCFVRKLFFGIFSQRIHGCKQLILYGDRTMRYLA